MQITGHEDLLHEMQAQYSKKFIKKVRDFQYPRDLEKRLLFNFVEAIGLTVYQDWFLAGIY